MPIPDASPDADDAQNQPIGLLSLETAESLALFFGEHADIRVLYTEADGTTPIVGATLRFGFEGMANDSTLAATEVTTDEDGRATGEVIAGHSEASYSVRISVSGGSAIYVETTVQDLGLGALRVTAPYNGSRPVEERTVRVLDSGLCTDADIATRAGIRSQVLMDGANSAQFFALDPGDAYVVTVTALGMSGATLATACEDGVVVEESTETDLNVLFMDEPLELQDAEFEMLLDVDASSASTTLHSTIASAGMDVVDTVGSDARLLLLRILANVEDEGGSFVVADVEAELTAALGDSGGTPTSAVYALADQIAGQIHSLALEARLETMDVFTMASEWQTMRVRASTETGSSVEFEFVSSTLGSPMSEVDLREVEGADEIFVPALNLSLRLGSLSELIWETLSDDAGYTDATALLSGEAGCETVIAWSRDISSIQSVCNDACVMEACVSAMELIELSIRSALLGLDDTRAVLHLEGLVDMADSGSDLSVDSLEGLSLSGRWGAVDDSDEIYAVLTGDRTAIEP